MGRREKSKILILYAWKTFLENYLRTYYCNFLTISYFNQGWNNLESTENSFLNLIHNAEGIFLTEWLRINTPKKDRAPIWNHSLVKLDSKLPSLNQGQKILRAPRVSHVETATIYFIFVKEIQTGISHAHQNRRIVSWEWTFTEFVYTFLGLQAHLLSAWNTVCTTFFHMVFLSVKVFCWGLNAKEIERFHATGTPAIVGFIAVLHH